MLTYSNPVFNAYAFWGAILVMKCLFMSIWTSFFRYKNKAHVSPEDAKMTRQLGAHGVEVNTNDPDVERVRRGHLNDLENILPYLFVCLLYIMTDPAVSVALWLFRLAALARIVHTIVYTIIVVPQPARGIAFIIHYIITLYMTVSVLIFSY